MTERSLSLEEVAELDYFRFRGTINRVERDRVLILSDVDSGTSVRVSAAAKALLPLLEQGSSFADLTKRLSEMHPTANDVEYKLQAFLKQLLNAGLLDSEIKPKKKRRENPRYNLFSLDPAAKLFAKVIQLVPAPVSWVVLGCLIVAALSAFGTLIFLGLLPSLPDFVSHFNAAGLGLFLFVMLPVHELCHGIACRLSGIKAGNFGIIVHGGYMPGPYVETPEIYTLKSKFKRFWIPAAGPVVNLITVGISATVLITNGADPFIKDTFTTLFFFSLMFVYFDTNPLTPSDGCHMIEAVLDDEMARISALSLKRAKLSNFKTVATYRVLCSIHLQTAALLVFLWWYL